MKKKIIGILMALVLSLPILSAPIQAEAEGHHRVQGPHYSQNAVNLNFTLRKLWIDHVLWTRSYIVSALAGLEDKDVVLKRLLQNQVDIGNAIKPYYGDAAGNQLGKLLTEHIVIAGKVVDAAKKGDQANLKKYNAEWYKNADDIAAFLGKANPYWSEKEMKQLLYTHLKLLTDAVVARIQKNWAGDVKAFDLGEDHILKLADALSIGIMKQFPNQFRH
jgi:REP element-mobilizing transposase RayT